MCITPRTGSVASLFAVFALVVSFHPLHALANPAQTVKQVEEYSISGQVYVDANGNFQWDKGEPALKNVSIDLHDLSGKYVATTLSNERGHYQFDRLVSADYQVLIPQHRRPDDFNKILFAWFHPMVGVQTLVPKSGSDTTRTNFAFAIHAVAIMQDLNPTDPDGDGFTFPGESQGSAYWTQQLKDSVDRKAGAKGTFTKVALSQKSSSRQINSELSRAHALMSRENKDTLDNLKTQILAGEFNYMSGKGMAGDYRALQAVLLKWGEFVVMNNRLYLPNELDIAKDIMVMMNGMKYRLVTLAQ